MIEINLLPEEIRKRKKPFKMPDIAATILPILIAALVLLVLTHAVLILTINVKKGSYTKMKKEWEAVQTQKRSVELLNRKNIEARKEVDAIAALTGKKISWSKKLNQLSDLIIPGVWFARLSIDKKVVAGPRKTTAKKGVKSLGKRLTAEKVEAPYFKIEGAVSSFYGEELAVIGKFIEQLKEDKDFFKDFSNIELGSTELHSISDTEVMKFNINCYFKER